LSPPPSTSASKTTRAAPGGTGKEAGAGVVGDEHRLEELTHDAERKLALELAAARRERPRARFARATARLGEKPALADPGGAFD
jgi:hypothetical protein